MILATGIDPGTTKSGVVVLDLEEQRVTYSAELDNRTLLLILRQEERAEGLDSSAWSALYIETIEAMGLPVGKSTLETMRWVGKFEEAFEFSTGREVGLIGRGDEKIILCGAATFVEESTGRRRSVTDAQIRQALISRFPGTGGGACPQVGTKAAPGPLYGVKGHAWSALSVVIVGLETVVLKGEVYHG